MYNASQWSVFARERAYNRGSNESREFFHSLFYLCLSFRAGYKLSALKSRDFNEVFAFSV